MSISRHRGSALRLKRSPTTSTTAGPESDSRRDAGSKSTNDTRTMALSNTAPTSDRGSGSANNPNESDFQRPATPSIVTAAFARGVPSRVPTTSPRMLSNGKGPLGTIRIGIRGSLESQDGDALCDVQAAAPMPSAIIASRKHDFIGNDYTFLERVCRLDERRNHRRFSRCKSETTPQTVVRRRGLWCLGSAARLSPSSLPVCDRSVSHGVAVNAPSSRSCAPKAHSAYGATALSIADTVERLTDDQPTPSSTFESRDYQANTRGPH